MFWILISRKEGLPRNGPPSGYKLSNAQPFIHHDTLRRPKNSNHIHILDWFWISFIWISIYWITSHQNINNLLELRTSNNFSWISKFIQYRKFSKIFIIQKSIIDISSQSNPLTQFHNKLIFILYKHIITKSSKTRKKIFMKRGRKVHEWILKRISNSRTCWIFISIQWNIFSFSFLLINKDRIKRIFQGC